MKKTQQLLLASLLAAVITSCSNSIIFEQDSPLSYLVFTNDLMVTGVSPAEGSTDVSTTITVQAAFSHDLFESSVNSSTFVVADEAYLPVPGSLAYDASGRMVTFTPAAALMNLAEYNVMITTDIIGLEGNNLAEEKIWYFTTISNGTVPPPSFSPAAGTYDGPQEVILKCREPGATIRYTLDGTMPSRTTGTLYSAPIPVSKNSVTPIQAIAYREGFSDSAIAASSYTIKVLAPVLDPPPGIYSSDTTVAMTTDTPGAVIQYTLDGTDPATSGTAFTYSFPVTVSLGTTVVTVVAVDPSSAMANSTVISYTYYVDYLRVAPPVFTPPIGVYTSSLSVTLSTPTAGATIKYTTDGSDPSATNGTVGSSVTITDTTVVKAYAYASGMVDSIITNSAGVPYIIAPRITAIVPSKGPNTGPVSVIIKGKNFKSGAAVRLALAGYPAIAGTSVTVIDSSSITCTFDISRAFQTKWDLIVENADGGSSINVKYFRIY